MGSFTVPITFSSESRDAASPSPIIQSFQQADVSRLISWARNDLPGAAVGCRDGSVYLFRPAYAKRTSPVSPMQQEHFRSKSPAPSRLSRPGSRISRSHESTPRSSSPSSMHHPTFTVTSPSRIVSGVTTAAVEAPKNFVDFDDEPDRLKGMLQGRSQIMEKPRKSEEATARPHAKEVREKKKTRKDPPKSLLSATNSPALTSKSLSNPSSPKHHGDLELDGLSLLCHVIPPTVGAGNAITDMHLVEVAGLLLVLQESGNLFVLDIRDGKCVASVDVCQTRAGPMVETEKQRDLPVMWKWTGIRIFKIEESMVVVVSAYSSADALHSFGQADTSVEADLSRVVLYVLHADVTTLALNTQLEELGQFSFNGPPDSAGLHVEFGGAQTFHYFTWDGHFICHSLHARAPPSAHSPDSPANEKPSLHRPLHHLFKSLKAPFPEQPLPSTVSGRIYLDEEHDLGMVISTSRWKGIRYQSSPHEKTPGARLRGLGWTDTELLGFEYWGSGFKTLFTLSETDISDIIWRTDQTFFIIRPKTAELYTFTRDEPTNANATEATEPRRYAMINVAAYDAMSVSTDGQILTLSNDRDSRSLRQFTVEASVAQKERILWHTARQHLSEPSVTSILPIELGNIVMGYADGTLRQRTFETMCHSAPGFLRSSEPHNRGYPLMLDTIQNPRTKESFMVGGNDDGSITFWTSKLELCASWTLFTTPLRDILTIPNGEHNSLNGCIFGVSQDGTIAVIAIDGFQFLYLIPAAPTPLTHVCLSENNLLLAYEDRARLWDVSTKEFWRSMTREKAQELVDQGGWKELTPKQGTPRQHALLTGLQGTSESVDAKSTMLFDLETFISESTAVIKSISSNKLQTQAIVSCRERLCALLSVLLTPGLNKDVDSICQQQLGIKSSTNTLGIFWLHHTSLYSFTDATDPWCGSGDLSAARAFAIVATLRTLALFEDLSEFANTVSAFYTAALDGQVGPLFQCPSLTWLAQRWFDSSNELRQVARSIFDSSASRLSDEGAIVVIEKWQRFLPSLQHDKEAQSASAALSLFVCGHLAADRYSLLSSSALTDISSSISLYLHDEQSLYRTLAIDLCSKGFHVWQNFVDAMQILRALFNLATTSKKEAITAQNVGGQARLAVLQIATANTALFMTTLNLDILTPATLDHRKAVMQIVAFLIRKRPLVLYPNLPKLMEAVVRSLDPNSTTNRDAILDTATEILGHVVKTYPSIDFHMASQRLAVGTTEGAMVMYDLKTATRLYVLEGHRKRITACTFSPDGRRLVTLSLEESVILVWKVGSSLSSFFNPGAPPRQGHGGSEPFKTMPFNVGDEVANLDIAETLDLVHVEWPTDRNVKVRILESVLTFAT